MDKGRPSGYTGSLSKDTGESGSVNGCARLQQWVIPDWREEASTAFSSYPNHPLTPVHMHVCNVLSLEP